MTNNYRAIKDGDEPMEDWYTSIHTTGPIEEIPLPTMEDWIQSASDMQVGGAHYKEKEIQPWDIIDEYGLDFYRGNVIKYVLRNKMDMYEDMEKAKHYMDKWLEVNKHLKEDN